MESDDRGIKEAPQSIRVKELHFSLVLINRQGYFGRKKKWNWMIE